MPSISTTTQQSVKSVFFLEMFQVDETCPIVYNSSQRKGVIEPNSIKDVPLFIEAQGLEELTVNAFFMIVGSQEAPLVSFLSGL